MKRHFLAIYDIESGIFYAVFDTYGVDCYNSLWDLQLLEKLQYGSQL